MTNTDEKEASRCDCLDKIQKKLSEHHKSEVELDLSAWIDIETFQPTEGPHPLRYSFMEGKTRKKSYLKFNFCPFCGKPQEN